MLLYTSNNSLGRAATYAAATVTYSHSNGLCLCVALHRATYTTPLLYGGRDTCVLTSAGSTSLFSAITLAWRRTSRRAYCQRYYLRHARSSALFHAMLTMSKTGRTAAYNSLAHSVTYRWLATPFCNVTLRSRALLRDVFCRSRQQRTVRLCRPPLNSCWLSAT